MRVARIFLPLQAASCKNLTLLQNLAISSDSEGVSISTAVLMDREYYKLTFVSLLPGTFRAPSLSFHRIFLHALNSIIELLAKESLKYVLCSAQSALCTRPPTSELGEKKSFFCISCIVRSHVPTLPLKAESLWFPERRMVLSAIQQSQL